MSGGAVLALIIFLGAVILAGTIMVAQINWEQRSKTDDPCGKYMKMRQQEYQDQEKEQEKYLKLRQEASQREKEELALVRKLIDDHINTLSRKRRALVRKGDYGELIDDGWRKEINRFTTVVLPRETYTYFGGGEQGAGEKLESFIDELVSEHMESLGRSAADTDISTMNGVEYEVFCGDILEREGWKVQRTPATGDHGVDLIAEKPGRRVAIQCKKYSTPVGNKAVQEAYSGMKFFDAKEAVVVSNSTFTQAAQVLANKLSVALKHHDELRGL